VNELNGNTIIAEIEAEYKKINAKWFMLHYRTIIGSAIFGFVLECIFGVINYASGILKISLSMYLLKYHIVPFLMNLVFILIGVWTVRLSKLEPRIKAYLISYIFVGICFSFYMVHNIFSSLYMIFFGPILFTLIYSDYIITATSALMAIAAKVISDIWIIWDTAKIRPGETFVDTIDFVISICVLCILSALCFIIIYFEKKKNAASILMEVERYQMRQKLITDELTKVYNRTALRYAFDNMEKNESGEGYLFAIIDIDNFKELNDRMGHDKGDQCLKEFGAILRADCGENALPVRFGGDEFCILFENSSIEEALEVCRKLQADLEKSVANRRSVVPVTISVGIAAYSKRLTARQLLKNSDIALYNAKAIKDNISVFEDLSAEIRSYYAEQNSAL